jgi:hypothetical protein
MQESTGFMVGPYEIFGHGVILLDRLLHSESFLAATICF